MASLLLDQVWKDGYRYAKAGVMLSDFYHNGVQQGDLFAASESIKRNSALMLVMDQINQLQPNSLYFASKGAIQLWGMKRELLSPSYTTNWRALPRVR